MLSSNGIQDCGIIYYVDLPINFADSLKTFHNLCVYEER